MPNVKFLVGSSSNFNAIESKDSNALYFLTDTLEIYKGDQPYTKSVKLVSELPSANQIQGVVYVNTTTFTLHAWNGSGWTNLTKGYAQTITETPTHDDVPTTKAVADYVVNKIADVVGGEGVFVTDVTYTPANGTLSVAKGSDPVTTVLSGVVNNPTYDSTTRTITLPVFGGDALTIALGKDAFVESGSYNAETKTIDLVLTSGDPVSIPVGSLVDIYVGIATPTATVTVNDQNEISVTVKVSATANNQITIEEDGLYVPLVDAYTKAEVDEKLKGITDVLTPHAANNDIHVTKAKQDAWDAKVDVDQMNSAIDNKVAAGVTDAKTYADGLNTAMDGRMKGVEDALTWGTV